MQEKGRAGGGQLWVAQTIIKQFGKRRLQVKEQQAVQCFRLELFKVDTRFQTQDLSGSSCIMSQTDWTSSWRIFAPDVSEHKLIHSCLSVIFCHSFHYQFLFRPKVCFFFLSPRVCDNDCCRRSMTPVLFFLLKPCLKRLDRLELICPKTSTKSRFWTSGTKLMTCAFLFESKNRFLLLQTLMFYLQ